MMGSEVSIPGRGGADFRVNSPGESLFVSVGLRVSHPMGHNASMADFLSMRNSSQPVLSFDQSTDCPLWKLCESVADDFVRACLKADDPHLVRRRLERDICLAMDFEPARAEALIDLALEVLHLRSEGSYQSEVTEIAYLMAKVSGGDDVLCLS